MKKLLLVAITIASIVGCKKDSEPAQVTVNATNLAGKWRPTAETTLTTITGQGSILLNTYDSTYKAVCDKFSSLTFRTNGTAVDFDSCRRVSTNLNYSLNGNKIILDGMPATITSLTANTSVFSFVDTLNNAPLTIETVTTTYTRF